MLYLSPLVSAASGRLGSLIASRNRGGAYFRTMGNPNPSPETLPQLWQRTALGVVHDVWSGLSESERRGWGEFAAGMKRVNRLGRRRPVSGYAEFVRANVMRARLIEQWAIDLGWIVAAPTSQRVNAAFGVSSCGLASGPVLRLGLVSPSPSWADDANAFALFWVSPGKSVTVNFYRSPMILSGIVQGGEPFPSVVDVAVPAGATSGKAVFVKTVSFGSDGSVSAPGWWRYVLS